MAIRAARNSRKTTRKYVTKVRTQIPLVGQKTPKRSERFIYKDTSQDDLESAGKIEQYHQKTLLTEHYI